jgi:NADH-quinone oxidoreductase subunit C
LSSEGSAEAPEAPAEVEAPPVDELRQGFLAVLQEELGDALVGSEVAGGDLWVRVDRTAWKRAGEVCRDRLHMDYFCFLSGIDWMPAPGLSGEKVWDPDAPTDGGDDTAEPTEMQTGVAGGDARFQVFARLYSTRSHAGITLKADLDEADPRVESWTTLFRGADWHEREAWEFFGFGFDGHPGLRHLYLPGEFEGHPLRKDFPLLAREVKPWPGLVDVEPMPGEPDGEAEGAEAAE